MFTSLALGSAIVAVSADPAAGQDVEGRIVDAATGGPVEGAIVRVAGQGVVTLSDQEGEFHFDRLDQGGDTVVVSRFGYVTRRLGIRIPGEQPLTIELDPAPIELEGVTTRATFPELYGGVQGVMDARLGVWPGRATVAGPADIRPFDEDWKSDPYSFLHYGPLKVSWMPNSSVRAEDPVYIRGYGEVRAEVFLDDRPVWLRTLIEYPNTQLCRVETYVPPEPRIFGRVIPGPPAQIRAYTCSFMSQVAMGLREMCPNITWGALLAGPGGGTSPPPEGGLVFRGRDARPGGAAATGESGGTEFVAPNTIGVGSGACR